MTKPYREIIQQGILYTQGQVYVLIEGSPVESPDAEYAFQWPNGTARFFVTDVPGESISEWGTDRSANISPNGTYKYIHKFPFHINTNSFLCDYSTRGNKILVEEPPDPFLLEEQRIDAQLSRSE